VSEAAAVKPNGKSASSYVTIVLGIILAAGTGFVASEWRNRYYLDYDSASPDTALKVPKELEVIVGEPVELRAETRGRKVMFMPLEKQVKIVPIDSKAQWVWATEKGDYRVISWTSVNNLPTPNQLTVLHAKDPK
jgi:hypothetical protein